MLATARLVHILHFNDSLMRVMPWSSLMRANLILLGRFPPGTRCMRRLLSLLHAQSNRTVSMVRCMEIDSIILIS